MFQQAKLCKMSALKSMVGFPHHFPLNTPLIYNNYSGNANGLATVCNAHILFGF